MLPHDVPADLLQDRQVAQLRVPPQSIESEASVLGSLLLNNAVWDLVGDLLTDSDFYRYEHRLIYAAIGQQILATRPADVLTTYEHLRAAGKAEEVGGMEYINALSQSVPSAGNIRRYAEIVRERSIMRKLVSISDEIACNAFAATQSVEHCVDQAQEALQSLQVSGGRAMPTNIDASVVGMLDRLQDLADGKTSTGIPTGIPGLDRMLGGGFKGGKQIIVAARPSVGKSSLAQQFCLTLARAGHPAAFFSQEMSKDELTDRAVANLGRIALDRIATGKLVADEWGRLTEAVEQMRNFPLFLDDQPALTLHDIGAKARMLKRQHGIKLIVIDYIQLCGGGKDDDTRHHQIEQLSRGLKTLARRLDITVITLSQLNREVEKRASGRPILSDLKESGSIEEDADVVVLLSRAGEPKDGFQIINCDIPKNRQGRVGSLALGFDGAIQQWHETTMPVEFKKPPRKHFTEDV
jgi:replicative DNA helicase